MIGLDDDGDMDQAEIEVTVNLVSETENAIQINDSKRTMWIPKSHVYSHRTISEKTFDTDAVIEIVIPEWLAIERGLL